MQGVVRKNVITGFNMIIAKKITDVMRIPYSIPNI
jgi:hypothetical protein